MSRDFGRTALMRIALLFFLNVYVVAADRDPSPRPGYLLTVPNALQVGTAEKICVTFHHLGNYDVNLNVDFRDQDGKNSQYSVNQTFQRGTGGCFEVTIPASVKASKSLVVVGGSTEFKGRRQRHFDQTIADYTFSGNATVSLLRKSLITFIQTDKPVYKPGQTVKFRILTIQRDLTPINDNIKVWVQNPAGVRVMQQLDAPAQSGIVNLEMPMNPEPVLGEWKINAEVRGKVTSQTFKIEEYVLPKFEVTVKGPPYISVDAKTFDVEICAKYTYGKPVKGTVAATACVSQRYSPSGRPCASEKTKIDGCATITFNASDVQLASNRWSLHDAIMKIEATVSEKGTDNSQSVVSEKTKIVMDRFTLKLTSPDYYKPNLPYYGEVKAMKPDNTPAVGELIQITVSSSTTGQKYEKNFTTDAKGLVKFSLPPFSDSAIQLSISALAVVYKPPSYSRRYYYVRQPTAHLTLKKWYSRSQSFLQIEPIQTPVECKSELPIEIYYTTPAGSQYEFHYMAISRGVTVDSGVKSHRHRPRRARAFDPAGDASGWSESNWHLDPTPSSETSPVEYVQSDNKAKFNLRIRVTPEMSPRMVLVVYYVREDGETVADHKEITIPPCVENEVGLNLTKGSGTVRPGASTDIKLTADPGSLCSLGVVDKSVHILGGDNQLTLDKVFENLKQYQLQETREDFGMNSYCSRNSNSEPPVIDPLPRPRPIPLQEEPQPDEPLQPEPLPQPMPVRAKRSFYGIPFSRYHDTIHSFNMVGVNVLSDLIVESRPCDAYSRPVLKINRSRSRARPMKLGTGHSYSSTAQRPPEMAEDDGQSNEVGEAPEQQLRDYFPETFLWDLHVVGPTGIVKLSKEVPHTITTWIGNTFCSSPDSGLGVSPTASLTVFQPFFASFNLPYSVVRGEKIPISVSVFNYLSECLVVKLVLTQEDWFEMVASNPVAYVCVCGGNKEVHNFYIRPNELGSLNLTVEAESVNQAGICGNDIQINTLHSGVKDAVRRPLLVEPEGKEVEFAKSLFVCPTDADGETDSLELALPTDGLVPDSARGFIHVIGDVMGPALTGLDELLRMPTGCGEQNMLNFAPNIFIMQYIKASKQSNSEIETKAIRFMESGYQRELNYRHNDGSYSAFGQSDPEGSMWLTAFVVKSFAQARPFIFIDQDDLDTSINWMRTKQLENGAWPQVGRVIHKAMKGGLAGEGSQLSLTAYVLIALLEAGVSKDDLAVKDAVLFLKSQSSDDMYTVALMTYAMSLYDINAPATLELMNKLDRNAIVESGMKYWKQSPQSTPPPSPSGWRRVPHPAPSAEVEIAGYALLSKLVGGGVDAVAKALPIVKWLTSQRNPSGGFASTQDTVIALQALASYATLVFGGNTTVSVKVQGQGIQETFSVDSMNTLLLQQRSVSLPNVLTVTTTGTGCVFIQAFARFNILEVTGGKDAAFALTVTTRRELEGKNQCRYRNLEICTKYNLADGESNMAVVSAKMLTGWIPVKSSLNDLINDKTLGLKRYEVDNNMVNFYFDELTQDFKCFVMKVEQDLPVGDLKPARVRVFDYYDNEKLAEATYIMKTTCGTKEEIPFGPNEGGDPNDMEQRRQPMEFPGGELLLKKASNCPVCFDTVPSDLSELFCSATKAYRVDVRKKKYPLKARKEMRDGQIDHLHIALRYTMQDGCECSPLTESGKVLILTKTTDIEDIRRRKRANTKKGQLTFAKDVTVVWMGENFRSVERSLRRYRRRNCP